MVYSNIRVKLGLKYYLLKVVLTIGISIIVLLRGRVITINRRSIRGLLLIINIRGNIKYKG